MPIEERVLVDFGLSEGEAKIYIEALKHTEISPYKLAQLTGIPRTTVYDLMMSLSLKELIELKHNEGLEKQQTRIKAKNPSVLRQKLKERHDALNSLEVDIVGILPKLKGEFLQNVETDEFKFYPGVEGAKYVYNSDYEDNVELPNFVFTHLTPMDAFGSKDINDLVNVELQKAKVTKFLQKKLIPLTDWTMHVVSYQYERNPDYIKVRELRYIDSALFDIRERISIKGDRVRITCEEGDEVWGLIMDSKAMARSYRSLFNLLWLQAKPITDEVVRSWGPNQYFLHEQSIGKSKFRNQNSK